MTNTLFKYKAIHSHGTVIRGMLHAKNERDLSNQLSRTKFELISSSEVRSGHISNWLRLRKRVSNREKIQLYTALSQLQQAGVMVLESLDFCIQSVTSQGMRDILSSMYKMVYDGSKFSEAMKKHPDVFSKIELNIIKAKEETGDLISGFNYLSEYLIKNDEIARRIKKATRYPIILAIVIVLTIIIMLGFVTPSILEFVLTVQSEEELPFATTSLMAVSSFFQNWVIYLVPILFFAALIVLVLRRESKVVRLLIDRMLLRLPLFGELLRKLEIARFCSTFLSLYASGLPFLMCVKLSNEVVGNEVIKSGLHQVHADIADGKLFNEALRETGLFPSIVTMMIAIAEEAGSLERSMKLIVDFFEKDIDDTIAAFIATIEPTLTIILGLVITWIAAAVFGPIYGSFEKMDF